MGVRHSHHTLLFSTWTQTALMFSPSPPSCSLRSQLHLISPSTLHLSGFVAPLHSATSTLSLLSLSLLPHVTPISGSAVCLVTARQSFFSWTMQHQNSIVTVENEFVFLERVCEVTYSHKALAREGVAATAP